jgi:CheY-like chemotaxis protein
MNEKTVILVVEDQAIIRLEAVQILEDAGFATIDASNADGALKILELRDNIRAVFTDINMPGTLDGLRLARAVRGRWPPIHLILTSGLMSPNEDEFPADGRFIRKPCQAARLIATLRELLKQNRSPDPDRYMGKAA